jgi:phasin
MSHSKAKAKTATKTKIATKSKTVKPASFSELDVTQAFRAMAKNGTAQAKEAFEKVTAATAETADLVKNSVVKAAQNYNNKVIEFGQTNTKVGIEFVQKLSGAKSPSDFIELWTGQPRRQLETLIEQTKELIAMVQKVTLVTVA